MPGTLENVEKLSGTIQQPSKITGEVNATEPVSGGIKYGIQEVTTKDYDLLKNKPQINHIELMGDRSALDLDLVDNKDEITVQDINDAWAAIFG